MACSRPSFNVYNGPGHEQVTTDSGPLAGIESTDDAIVPAPAEIAVDDSGRIVRIYNRTTFIEHKQLALGVGIGGWVALLFATGLLSSSSPSPSTTAGAPVLNWFAGWLALAPLAFMAIMARQQQHYLSSKTRLLRSFVWVYLGVCALLWVSVSGNVGVNAPGVLRSIMHDDAAYALATVFSAFGVVWFVSLGRWVPQLAHRLMQHAPNLEIDDRIFDQSVHTYTLIYRHIGDMLALVAFVCAALAGISTIGYHGGFGVMHPRLSRWGWTLITLGAYIVWFALAWGIHKWLLKRRFKTYAHDASLA